MSGKDRKKKGGQDKNKKNERMREAVKERHESAGEGKPQTDHGDMYPKPNSQMIEGPSNPSTGGPR
jgi:hypothetical protein